MSLGRAQSYARERVVPTNIPTQFVETKQRVGQLDLSKMDLHNMKATDILFPRRPGFGRSGKEIALVANHYITELSNAKAIFHYDLSIVDVEKTEIPTGRMRDIMEMLRLQHGAVGQGLGGKTLAFDGRANVYTCSKLPFEGEGPFNVEVEPAKGDKPARVLTLVLKLVATRDLAQMAAFFNGTASEAAYDCIAALDVALRHAPAMSATPIGRNFYSPVNSQPISNGAEVWSGWYQSLRPTQAGLTLNVDTTATAFMTAVPVMTFVLDICSQKDRDAPRTLKTRGMKPHDRSTVDKALKGMKVEVSHRQDCSRKFRISGLTKLSAEEQTFPDEATGRKMSVAQYFASKYRKLEWPKLPCFRVGPASKHNYLPMEVCTIASAQRINKLSETQTADMIRITCVPPHIRRGEIHRQMMGAQAGATGTATNFGIKITEKQVALKGRMLQAPGVQYGKGSKLPVEKPTMGAWNMRDKQFFLPKELAVWGVVSMCAKHTFPLDSVKHLVTELVKMMKKCGLKVSMERPPVLLMEDYRNMSVLQVMTMARDQAFKAAGSKRPCQLLLCPKMTTDSQEYGVIKIASDTALGLPSQVLLMKHLREPKPQYLANVCLKINAKLGGTNSVLSSQLPVASEQPTIVFGADVNHPGAGNTSKPSIAAVVASMDSYVSRHCGAVRAQEHRKEVITELEEMVTALLKLFFKLTRVKPKRIIFFRDGVSEGQFREVLQYEVRAITRACQSLEKGYAPTITFVVVQKRHHTRLFAPAREDQDRSGNVPPGTVVDSAICHPFEFDFYLMSHAGLQGTSRPAHYHVLWDQNGFTADMLQELAYRLCYNYCRCTRAVSIVPAVYYAHLIAFRAAFFVHDEDSSDGRSTNSGGGSRGAGGAGANVDWAAKFESVHPGVAETMFFV